jgi:Leucine rich repeat variant
MQPLISVTASDLQAFLPAPKKLLQQSIEFQLAVASYPDTARGLLEILVNSPHKQVAEAASLHVNWAGEIMGNWREEVDTILGLRQLGQNDRLAVELLKLAPVPPCFFSEWVPSDHLIQGLRNPYMPLHYRLQLLTRLGQGTGLEPRLQVAESLETPLPVLEKLAGDLELPIRLTVKFNPSCPQSLIELVEGQHTIASNWNTDAKQLTTLAQSRWAWVRLAVAQNPSTPHNTLLKLAEDPDFKIQLAVARNPSSSATLLDLLVKHPENSPIHTAVAEHPNTSTKTLLKLLPIYKRTIIQRNTLPTSFLEVILNETAQNKEILKDYELCSLLLKKNNIPGYILSRLQGLVENNINYLADIAKHPQVLVDTLEKLAKIPHTWVKLVVAQNSKTPDAIRIQLFEELSLSTEEIILEAVASDLNTPIYILEKIAEQESQQNKFRVKLQKILTEEPDEEGIESIPYYPIDVVRKIIKQYQSNIDVEEWMTIIDSYRWMTLLENYNYFGNLEGRYDIDEDFRDMVNEQWRQLLPTVPNSPLETIIANILEIADRIVEVIREERKVSVALVGNPNTPVTLREELQGKLTRPLEKLSSYSNDSDMRMALAYNIEIPIAQRIEYFQQLLATEWHKIQEEIAISPDTPSEIIAQIITRKDMLSQVVSRNPNAPVSTLAEFAQDENIITRTWVAENPSTPADILVELARQAVEEKIQNIPTVRERALKNPNFPILERYRLLIEIEQEEETAKAHELIVRRTGNPYALAHLLEKDDHVAKLSAASSSNQINVLERLAKDSDEMIRISVTQNPNTPQNSLLKLAQDSSYNVRLSLARFKHPIHRDVLSQLLQYSDERIRIEIASNLHTPPDILTVLASDSDSKVKVSAIVNPNLPSEFLHQILPQIQNEEEIEGILRGKIVTGKRNPQIPASFLEQLSQHPKDTIRYLIASYPTTSSTTLERLAFDKYKLVCEAVAENPNTPLQVLIEMARRDEVTSRDGCYHTISNKIAMRKDAPPEALWFIARKPVAPIAAVVAAHPNTPASALEWLAENETDEGVLCIIVRHPNVTNDIWTLLAANKAVRVREAIAAQVQCPSEILAMLANDITQVVRLTVAANPNTPINFIESFSRDENPVIRGAAASNPNLSITSLKKLANDEKVEVRRVVAQNPNTPEVIRETLQDLVLQPLTPPTISPTLRWLSRLYNPSTDNLTTILMEYASPPTNSRRNLNSRCDFRIVARTVCGCRQSRNSILHTTAAYPR